MGVGWGHMSGVEYVAAFGGITPGGMMEQGKTAISKPVTGSVTGVGNRANLPRMDEWQGWTLWSSLLVTANNIMGYQKQAPRLDSYPK